MRLLLSLLMLLAIPALAQRARDLGVPFDGRPGALNAITDVAGVEVGHVTLIAGDAVRTGVTAVLPRGHASHARVFAAWSTLNGNGEMTGTTWVEESGHLETAVVLTNTNSVGIARDAVVEWHVRRGTPGFDSGSFSLPVVAETWDGFLNDISGFHVKKEHVFRALESARGGAVAEGNVGGGTGMMAYGFKGGIGTASRVLPKDDGGWTVGVLVQANYGRREQLRIAGVPVGREITDLRPNRGGAGAGSIIVIVATDAPLLPHQLKRLTRRTALGIASLGGRGENSSGDIFLAFSTANPENAKSEGLAALTMLPNERITPLFHATADATEEAIVNALVAAKTMHGIRGNTVHALPHDRLRDVLRRYARQHHIPGGHAGK